MAFWDFFKKETKTETRTESKTIKPEVIKSKHAWAILGPAHLSDLTIERSSQNKLKSFEWDGQLKAPSGGTKFKIKFYGRLHEYYKNLIVRTDFAPAMIYAVDTLTQEEILIFDGCKHGYNAPFETQIEDRKVENFYIDKDGNDTFEIIISAYYQIDFDDENEDYIEGVDENGLFEIDEGVKVDFETFKRNGFDFLQILAITSNGKTVEILSEELS